MSFADICEANDVGYIVSPELVSIVSMLLIKNPNFNCGIKAQLLEVFFHNALSAWIKSVYVSRISVLTLLQK